MRRALLVLAAVACGHHHKTVTVTIHQMKFDPDTITVGVGDTVVFANQDLVPHTATDKGKFDSGPIDPDRSWTFTAAAKGDYPFQCTLHTNMTGTITVR